MRPSIFQQSSKSLLSSPQSGSSSPISFSNTNEQPKKIKKVESDRCIPVARSDEFSPAALTIQKKSLFCGDKKSLNPPILAKQEVIEWLCGNSQMPFEEVLKTSFQTPSSSTSICLHYEPNESYTLKNEDNQGEEFVSSSSRRIRRKKPQIYSSAFESEEKFGKINMQLSSPLNTSLSLIDSKQQDKKKHNTILILGSPKNSKVEQQPQLFKAQKILFKEDILISNSGSNWVSSPVMKESLKLQDNSPASTPKSENIKKLQVRLTDKQSKEPTNNGSNSSKFSVENVYEEFIKHSSPAKSNLTFSSCVSKLLGTQNQNNQQQQSSNVFELSNNVSSSAKKNHKTPLDEVAKAEAHSREISINLRIPTENIVNNDKDDDLSDFEIRQKAKTIDTCSSSSSINYKPEKTESLYKSILKNPKVPAFEAIFSDYRSSLDQKSPSTPKRVSFAV